MYMYAWKHRSRLANMQIRHEVPRSEVERPFFDGSEARHRSKPRATPSVTWRRSCRMLSKGYYTCSVTRGLHLGYYCIGVTMRVTSPSLPRVDNGIGDVLKSSAICVLLTVIPVFRTFITSRRCLKLPYSPEIEIWRVSNSKFSDLVA